MCTNVLVDFRVNNTQSTQIFIIGTTVLCAYKINVGAFCVPRIGS